MQFPTWEANLLGEAIRFSFLLFGRKKIFLCVSKFARERKENNSANLSSGNPFSLPEANVLRRRTTSIPAVGANLLESAE